MISTVSSLTNVIGISEASSSHKKQRLSSNIVPNWEAAVDIVVLDVSASAAVSDTISEVDRLSGSLSWSLSFTVELKENKKL